MPEYYAPQPNHLNGRYTPNGEMIKQLRINKAWTHEDLASRAECSPRTIGNLERGRRAYAVTIARVAAVFGQKFSALLLNPPPGPPPIRDNQDAKHRPAVEKFELAGIELDESLEQFDETRQLAEFIALLAKALTVKRKKIKITCIIEGSVVIQMRIPRQAAVRLLDLFLSKGLTTLPSRVLAINLPSDLRIPLSEVERIAGRVTFRPGFETTIRIAYPQLKAEEA